MKKNLIEKYLTEDSPIGFTFDLMDDQLDEFMKLLKMETMAAMDSKLKAEYNKLLKQFTPFKKSLSDFVKKLEATGTVGVLR